MMLLRPRYGQRPLSSRHPGSDFSNGDEEVVAGGEIAVSFAFILISRLM